MSFYYHLVTVFKGKRDEGEGLSSPLKQNFHFEVDHLVFDKDV